VNKFIYQIIKQKQYHWWNNIIDFSNSLTCLFISYFISTVLLQIYSSETVSFPLYLSPAPSVSKRLIRYCYHLWPRSKRIACYTSLQGFRPVSGWLSSTYKDRPLMPQVSYQSKRFQPIWSDQPSSKYACNCSDLLSNRRVWSHAPLCRTISLYFWIAIARPYPKYSTLSAFRCARCAWS